MSWFRGSSAEALAGSTCAACGQSCSETDRGLVVMHAECVRWVKETVARESDFPRRPYDGLDTGRGDGRRAGEPRGGAR
jgi:hypothetical protein